MLVSLPWEKFLNFCGGSVIGHGQNTQKNKIIVFRLSEKSQRYLQCA